MVFFLTAAARPQEIFEAIRRGDVQAVKVIVEKSPAVLDSRDGNGFSPLHYAAGGGNAALVAYLIDKGAMLEPTNIAETPLHIAAANDRSEAAAVLIKRGASLEARDDNSRTALILCARERGQAGTARVLLEAGAAIDAADKSGDTALSLAAWRGKADLVGLLLERGAQVPGSGPKWRQLLFESASRGLTELFRRTAAGDRDLKAGTGPEGGLLHTAAKGGSPEIIATLLDRGFGPAEKDAFGWTPLHYAALNGRDGAARTLIERGAPLDARTIAGQTPYNVAMERGMSTVAKLLSDKGAGTGQALFPVLEGEYLGQTPPPEGKAEIFAPGIISSIWGPHSSAVFSPDGNEVYWAPMMTFPGEIYSRGGLLMMKREGGRWSAPGWAPFSGPEFNDDVPFFSRDGRRIYFISSRPLPGRQADDRERIWFADQTASGWSGPRPIDDNVNEMRMHWQFSLDADGDLYFSSSAPGGQGLGDIYRSRSVEGRYERPVNLGGPVNSAAGESTPFIAPDGSYLLFSRDYIIMAGFRRQDGSWSEPVGLGQEANGICPTVTPDGRYLFFISMSDGRRGVYWMRADVIEKARHDVERGRPARAVLKLDHVANAGVLVSSGGKKVLIDALFDKPNKDYRAPSPETIDRIMKGAAPFDGVGLVLVTHNHPDHFDALLAADYLRTFPNCIILAPADAAEEVRKAARDRPGIGPRIVSLDLKVGEKDTRTLNGITVNAFRTLHSSGTETPMNVMYLIELDGRLVFHEGDSGGGTGPILGFLAGVPSLDLALVHFWFPLDPEYAKILQANLRPEHIALTHLPIRLEGDAPGKIDQVRKYYADIFLLRPGMPERTIP